jgi:hypothetical protein
MAKSRRKKLKSNEGSALPWIFGSVFLSILAFSLTLRYGDLLIRPRSGEAGEIKREEILREHREQSIRPDDAEALGLRLQVLNATRVSGLALRKGESLRPWGVDALDRGNAPPWPFNETLLLVRSGERAAVDRLAAYLGDVPVLVQRREDLMLDATLILGQDWQRYHWPLEN